MHTKATTAVEYNEILWPEDSLSSEDEEEEGEGESEGEIDGGEVGVSTEVWETVALTLENATERGDTGESSAVVIVACVVVDMVPISAKSETDLTISATTAYVFALLFVLLFQRKKEGTTWKRKKVSK